METRANEPQCTVIIPVYNVEEYLASCLDSVLAQTMSDIEILCIDDGSSDGSPQILKKYATKDWRIRVIRQENSGLGAARNHGLAVARGRFIVFLDSDDMIAPETVEKAVSVLSDEKLNVVFFEAKVLVEDGSKHDLNQYSRSRAYPGVWRGSELFLSMWEHGDFFASACLYAVPKDFIVEHGLSFPEGCIHEDEPFTFRMMMDAERCGVLSDAFYIRRYRPGSIMTARRAASSYIGYYRALAICLPAEGEDEDEIRRCWQIKSRALAVGCVANAADSRLSYARLKKLALDSPEGGSALPLLVETGRFGPIRLPLYRFYRCVRGSLRTILGTVMQGI